jgi:predicted acylesterase/phospholipase RssA
MDNNKEQQQIHLFRNIALTFSGGGYRASTFGLGVLSYFNKVQFDGKPLLQNVKGLSTVSGGTLTGATYASSIANDIEFDAFYKKFYDTLESDKLLGIALKNLENDELWKTSHKKRSLINAFALAYKEILTDATFKDIKEGNNHLEDICFNATDFSFGLAFRFQTTGLFGNYRLQNNNLNLLSNDMHVADAIASSSCFPMGFEPIIMPDDFVSNHNSDTYIAIKVQKEFEKGVGIMDGGIVDNQGIGSIMNTEKRREKEGNSYDLIMVCDVGSYFMDPWEPSTVELDKKTGTYTPKSIYNLIHKKLKSNWLIIAPLLITAALLFSGYYWGFNKWLYIASGASGILTILSIILKCLINKGQHKILDLWNSLIKIVPGFMKDKLVRFENLKLRLIKRMIEERGTSAVKLVSEIFLKQIRRLNYNLFYTNDNLKDRRITALIYELTKDQYKHNKSDEKDIEIKDTQIKAPGDRIYASAKIASRMGTTLWFSEKDKKVHRLKNLVSCGQYTACYNLLKYCIDLKKSNAKVNAKILDAMIVIFQADWNEFIKDPYWLHDKEIKQS